jgi:hypothetical protein
MTPAIPGLSGEQQYFMSRMKWILTAHLKASLYGSFLPFIGIRNYFP